MSKCGLDECDLAAGCVYDCDYSKEQSSIRVDDRTHNEMVGKISVAGQIDSYTASCILTSLVPYINNITSSKKAPKWQPIETAPTDGTYILVCVAGEEFHPVTVHRNMGGWEKHFATRDRVHHMLDLSPTHWMPLPRPPYQPTKGS